MVDIYLIPTSMNKEVFLAFICVYSLESLEKKRGFILLSTHSTFLLVECNCFLFKQVNALPCLVWSICKPMFLN